MLKLGDGLREQIARVAIWTGINIDWSKRTGRLQLASISRETLDLRAHIPEFRRLHRKILRGPKVHVGVGGLRL
jgi:hypothetical protein